MWGNLTSSGSEDSWETRKMSKMINDNGWRMTTEWGSGNEYDSTFQHLSLIHIFLSAPDWMFPADVALPAKPSSNDVLSMVAQSLRWISLFAYLRHGYSNRWLGRDTR